MSAPTAPLRFDAAADAAGAAVEEALVVLGRAAARANDPGAVVQAGLPKVHRRLERFVARTFAANPERKVHCASGCSACCHQWVHDVGAHEIERLGAWVLASGRAREVQEALHERLAAYRALERRHPDDGDEPDPQLSRALAYLAERRPCVFLEDSGACGVYADRPWTCRTYFSLAPPSHCTAEALRAGTGLGVFLEPFADVDAALDAVAEPFSEPGYTGELVRDLATWLGRRLSGSRPRGGP